mmetsp:Transcript_20462/g.46314  ORF Transcript_20462/g.46314 Transcript_20462/m.46314 type:complete len:186 (+) Transcript_20462:27-584(+)
MWPVRQGTGLGSSLSQGALPPVPGAGRRTIRPLLPVMRNTKAFHNIGSLQRELPEVRDFFAMACRTHNPHETQFHMEARLGFRRPKLPASHRLRPVPAAGEDRGEPTLGKVLPWRLRNKYAPSAGPEEPERSRRPTPGFSDSHPTSWTAEADDEVVVDLVDDDTLAAETVGKALRHACFAEADRP